MNKTELIAKCKEIEPKYHYKFVNDGFQFEIETEETQYGFVRFGISKTGACINAMGVKDGYIFLYLSSYIPKILTLAQQYFKGNEN